MAHLIYIAVMALLIVAALADNQFTVTRYKNDRARLIAQDNTARSENLRFSVINNGPDTLWAWIEIKFSDYWDPLNVADPSIPGSRKVKLEPQESVEIGNFRELDRNKPFGGQKFPASARALRGCNSRGEDCAEYDGAVTKWEFVADPAGDKDKIGYNLSLVDGFNIGGYFAFAAGSDCKEEFECTPTKARVDQVCPSDRLWEKKGFKQCVSDCKKTGTWDDCSGPYPSSKYLKDLCPKGYAWSSDHFDTYRHCHPRGEFIIVVGEENP